jgi:hypothetical protein
MGSNVSYKVQNVKNIDFKVSIYRCKFFRSYNIAKHIKRWSLSSLKCNRKKNESEVRDA